MLDPQPSSIAAIDEAFTYCQYVQECCPNLDLDFLDTLDINIYNTKWEEPESAIDFNNIAVMAMIEANNTDDLSERSLYLEYAIEALKQGCEIPDGFLCKAHLAVAYSILGGFDRAALDAYHSFFDALQYKTNSQEKPPLGLVYLPRFSLNWSIICQEKLPAILKLDDGNKQALAIMMEVIYQSQPNLSLIASLNKCQIADLEQTQTVQAAPEELAIEEVKPESTTVSSPVQNISDELATLTETKSNKDNFDSYKILLVVSGGLQEFIENTLVSIHKCNIELSNVEIFAPRSITTDLEILQLKYGFGGITAIEDICDENSLQENNNYHDYDTPLFAKFTIYKWKAIKNLFDRGINHVIYTDVDIAWRHNPINLLQIIHKSYDMALQTESTSDFPCEFCTGFMSFVNTEMPNKLLDFLIAEHTRVIETNPTYHDQIVFNNCIATNTFLLKLIFTLSEVVFANGLLAKLMSTVDEDIQKIQVNQPDPFIFHANWTVGLENKKKILQMTGNWFI